MNEEEIRRVAVSEVINPSLDLTRQFLGKNKVAVIDDLPMITDIEIDEKEKIARVYFEIEDEDFYFVVDIDINTYKPEFSHMSPGSRVYFTAVSDEPNLCEMMGLIDFIPTLSWEKNQRRNNSDTGTYNYSRIVYEHIQKRNIEVDDKLNDLIDFLYQRREMIQHLSQLADVGIQVAYYGYKEQMWGVHLKKDIVRKMSEIGLYIDIDLYAGGQDLVDIP